MASWMVHFRIADYFLEKIVWLDKKCFIVGNIGPDCGEPNDDWSEFTPPSTITHWISDGLKKQNIDTDYFYEKYIKSINMFDSEIEKEKFSIEQKSFYLGYYIHLLTDVSWSLKIGIPIREKYAKEFEVQQAELWWVIKKDWYDLDHLYLKKNPDFKIFRIFDKIKEFKNNYFDYYSETAIIRQIRYISGFYNDEHEGLAREYIYLKEVEMDQFVRETVQEINKVLKEQDIISCVCK